MRTRRPAETCFCMLLLVLVLVLVLVLLLVLMVMLMMMIMMHHHHRPRGVRRMSSTSKDGEEAATPEAPTNEPPPHFKLVLPDMGVSGE